ncbi:MAG: hypothetical protein M3N13_04410, partial [Candidatus Eremiobacteraeota bacterium]|nr:hypothetical protein [Candidatus Eremiobacteraeota bacterium]
MGFLFVSLVLAASACSGSGSGLRTPAMAPSSAQYAAAPGRLLQRRIASAGVSPIRHIVIVIQENRTFENVFHGYPGAHTVTQGSDSNGKPVTLQPIHLMTPYDPAHRYHDWLTEYNRGGMNGFNNEILDYGKHAPPDFAYAYAMRSDVRPYWEMAANGTLSDATFADHRSPSFAGHQFPIAGASGPISNDLPLYYAAENPRSGTDCSAPGPGSAINIETGAEDRTYMSCFTYATIADLLNAKSRTWAYYVPRSDRNSGVNGFAAIKSVRFGPQWKTNIISPETQLFTDIGNGKLANVTYVVGQFVNSDHAGQNVPSSNGPAWVKRVE